MTLHLGLWKTALALTHSTLYVWGVAAAGLHLLQIPVALMYM